jgi:hypothetical protein
MALASVRVLEDGIPGYRPMGARGEELQDLELLRRKWDQIAGWGRQFAPIQIQAPAAERYDLA